MKNAGDKNETHLNFTSQCRANAGYSSFMLSDDLFFSIPNKCGSQARFYKKNDPKHII